MADCRWDSQAATISKQRELLVTIVALKYIANASNSARIVVFATWTLAVK